jgi:D-tyrosyl-tRNA(Tyr) deacylase
MKIVLQRVSRASVEVGGRTVGSIGRGLCLLVGIEKGDTPERAEALARKAVEMRIFPDAAGKMNLGLAEAGGEVLAVSQFTLAGSVRKGRRPSFDNAEVPEKAALLFERFVALVRAAGFRVETGIFQAEMIVRIENDGPVTFVLEAGPDGPVS